MSYWDTSALVKLYAKEPDSAIFENYALQIARPMLSSRIALYEARATFRRKEAEGILQAGTAQTLFSQLVQDVGTGEVHLLDLGADVEDHYGQVLDLCYQQNPFIAIRTLDAIHLASARVAGDTEIVATDRRMREAAHLLGFSRFPA
jgi:predicted nucleic acid-binding protein